MNRIFFHRGVWLFAVMASLILWAFRSPAQYTNGIYAEFNTSMGSYTCRLEYVFAPKAVANFIGLAAGQRAWLDLPLGVTRTNPFYNGTLFHRVIAGFVIQGGSPNGVGTDGPGYSFVDEFTPSLRHSGFGILSVANSGPDSNGSQYFVTVSAQPQLDDVHTIFGRLFGGSNVIYAINHVMTDANDKPLTNVVVQSIAIRRIGSAAQAFDINAQSLPVVTNLNLQIARAGANVSLTFSNRLFADNRLYASATLSGWSAGKLGIETAAPVSNTITQSTAAPVQFFHAAQIQYATSTFAPKTVLSRTLTLSITNGGLSTLVLAFDSAGGGNYTYTGNPPGTITSYTWIQEAFNGKLWPIFYSGLVPMTLALNYDSATVGTLTGTAYPFFPSTFNSFPFSGTFSSSP